MGEPKSDLAVREQVATVMCALETATETIRRVNHEAKPDRELVAASFATLLAKLKQAAQPVVFHPNMLDMGRALIALREAGLPDAIALRARVDEYPEPGWVERCVTGYGAENSAGCRVATCVTVSDAVSRVAGF